MMNRRSLLVGFLTAPAIVHAGNLMPIKVQPEVDPHYVKSQNNDWGGWVIRQVDSDGSCIFIWSPDLRTILSDIRYAA